MWKDKHKRSSIYQESKVKTEMKDRTLVTGEERDIFTLGLQLNRKSVFIFIQVVIHEACRVR